MSVVAARRHGSRASSSRGQALTEFALLAPLMLLILALIFTGSQYLNTVVGLNSAVRAGAIFTSNYMTDANGSGDQNVALAKATEAVNAEWGPLCNNAACFAGVGSSSACSPTSSTPGCVWVDGDSVAPSSRHIETIHVSYLVNPYIPIVRNVSVTALAGAEYR